MTVDPNSLKVIGVVGAGAMGAGIAQTALTAGLRVILHDTNGAMLNAAREQILSRIARLVEKGQVPQETLDQANVNLLLAPDLAAFAPAEVVIEAIVEKLEPKQALFAALEKIIGPEAVLATNTSSLSIAGIARACERRGRVCGMHFFNPVPLMKLVEVIAGAATSGETVATAMALSKRLGKIAVEVKDVPGFLVNLIGRAYSTEALNIEVEGVAPPAVIDQIMREACGFRMGPFELMDLTGIDVNFPVTRYIYESFQHDPRLKTTILHEALYNAGTFGRKSGRGFHAYSDGTLVPPAPVSAMPSMAAPSVFVAGDDPGFEALIEQGLKRSSQAEADVILIAPRGEDAATASVRMKLDPKRVVAIDFVGVHRKFLTLMAPLGDDGHVQLLAADLRAKGYAVAVIKDSPGFVAPRMLSMIVNLACEVAQMGIGTPEGIDTAMCLAQNYPRGPLEWAAWLGPDRVFETLSNIQSITGSDRYRPSLWLRRRAQLGLPIHTPS